MVWAIVFSFSDKCCETYGYIEHNPGVNVLDLIYTNLLNLEMSKDYYHIFSN